MYRVCGWLYTRERRERYNMVFIRANNSVVSKPRRSDAISATRFFRRFLPTDIHTYAISGFCMHGDETGHICFTSCVRSARFDDIFSRKTWARARMRSTSSSFSKKKITAKIVYSTESLKRFSRREIHAALVVAQNRTEVRSSFVTRKLWKLPRQIKCRISHRLRTWFPVTRVEREREREILEVSSKLISRVCSEKVAEVRRAICLADFVDVH